VKVAKAVEAAEEAVFFFFLAFWQILDFFGFDLFWKIFDFLENLVFLDFFFRFFGKFWKILDFLENFGCRTFPTLDSVIELYLAAIFIPLGKVIWICHCRKIDLVVHIMLRDLLTQKVRAQKGY
jgi:hypothetical protein